jgi:Leucine Rich repeat
MRFVTTLILLALSGQPGSDQSAIHKSPARENAIAQLRKQESAYFSEARSDQAVKGLCLRGPDVNDSVMEIVADLAEICELKLIDTRVTTVGLRRLEHLPRLRLLSLEGARVDDGMMEPVAALTGLRRLDLTDTRVTDVGIRRLGTLVELEDLRLDGLQINDEGLSALAPMKHLGILFLQDTRIHGSGLHHLAPLTGLNCLILEGPLETIEGLTTMKGLKVLFLCDTRVTDRGFEALKRIPNLEKLVLNGETVTDQKLEALPGFPHLKELGFTCVEFKTSESAAEQFRKGIPGIKYTGDTCGGANLSKARRQDELERRRLLRQGIHGRIRLAWRSAIHHLR